MRNLINFILILISSNCLAQDYASYAVSNIPVELKANADVVIRSYTLNFRILSSFKLKQEVYEVKTILNKSAERASNFVLYYDKFRSIKKFNATTLDKNGKVVKKLKKIDVLDISIAGNSVDDSRVKAAEMAHTEYPYTVVFEYVVEYDGLFYYPNYIPQFNERVAIQSSSFTVNFPDDLIPRYLARNIELTESTSTTLKWEINELPAFVKVPYSPQITEFVPFVLTAPTDFELDGHKGNMTTWAGFAEWYNILNKDRDILNKEDSLLAVKLTGGISSEKGKIKAIYEYMQSKTRYVSVQLGIGGYQTMLATEVAEDGWGDCKALTNYTKALLSSAGIQAYPALVYAGRGVPNIVSEFSSNQFNHVILCIPLEQDTVWLECTSREVPFNFLGSFTGDRDVLFIDGGEDGGKIIRTPRYNADVNYKIRKAIVTLDKEGNGNAKIVTNYGGLSFDKLLPYLDESEDKLKKAWYERIKIPGYKIDHIGFDYDKSKGPQAMQELELTLKNYASKSGKRFFFKPNLINRSLTYPKISNERKLEVVTSSEYLDIDTIEYHLPEGFHPEYLPDDVEIESQFGTYSATYKMNENGFIYVRRIKRNKGNFPSESFKELAELLKKIKRTDNQKVVLVGAT